MSLKSLVDLRAEDFIVVLNAQEKNFTEKTFYLNFDRQADLCAKVTRSGSNYSQHFSLDSLLRDLRGDVTVPWAENLFLTSLAVARAETLGARKVYVPKSIFEGVVTDDFYTRLNALVDEGTDKQTHIEIIPFNDRTIPHTAKVMSLNPSKSLVLASGGTDNTVVAALENKLGNQVGLLQIMYQQAARFQETWCVKQLANDLNAQELVRIELDVLKHFGGSALLRDDFQLKDGVQSLEYVPFRNSIFLAMALIRAASKNYGSVLIGAHCDDTMAPDGTKSYVQAFNKLLSSFTFETPVIKAPLHHFGGKPELLKLGLDLGVDYSHTWSCHTYVPQETSGPMAVACGTCGNCITRYSAFEKISHVDPIPYKEKPVLRTKWSGHMENYDSLLTQLGLK